MACKITKVGYKKRPKAAVLIMLPFAALVWFVGWSLACIGETKIKLKPALPHRKENLALATLFPKLKFDAGSRSYTVERAERVS